MAWAYYYTPCFSGNRPDVVHPDTGEVFTGTWTKEPCVDLGSGVELAPSLPLGMVVLKYDDPETRCVVKLPTTSPPLYGWVEKTSSEVLTDYPDLPGVV